MSRCSVIPRNSQVEVARWARPSPELETGAPRSELFPPPTPPPGTTVNSEHSRQGDEPSTQDSVGSQRKERDSRRGC